jgi:hypothetical protein
MVELVDCNRRIGTGPVRFGTDWTGVFIRGDECLERARILRLAAAYVRSYDYVGGSLATALNELADILESALDTGDASKER